MSQIKCTVTHLHNVKRRVNIASVMSPAYILKASLGLLLTASDSLARKLVQTGQSGKKERKKERKKAV